MTKPSKRFTCYGCRYSFAVKDLHTFITPLKAVRKCCPYCIKRFK